MGRIRYRLGRLALTLGVVALCWACNAPFLPIPPPGQTATFTSSLVSNGAGGQKTVWIAQGPPSKYAASALFFVFDTNRSAGVIAQAAADGSYTSPPMDGATGDRVEVSYETPAGALSMDICFQLTDQVLATPGGPSAPKCEPP